MTLLGLGCIIIFKEIEDIGVLSGVGAGAIDVAPVYLCGAQAVGYGVASRWKSAEELFESYPQLATRAVQV